MYYYEEYALYYDRDENVMIDEDGFIVHDIYRIVHPRYMKLFLEGKKSMVVPSRLHPTELGIILEYPDDVCMKGQFYNY